MYLIFEKCHSLLVKLKLPGHIFLQKLDVKKATNDSYATWQKVF